MVLETTFIQLINEHQRLLLRICRVYAHNTADAEDLFQEMVLQLWKAWPRFRQESKVTTWMYRIALNTAITGLRKSGRSLVIRELPASSWNMPADDVQRIDVEYAGALQRAVNALNNFDKSLMVLYLEEKTYAEMAAILGISETNVGVKINRIKKQLKQILNP